MRYLLVTYQWRILTRPQVAAFDCPVTDNPEDRRMLLLKTTPKGKTLVANLREGVLSKMSSLLTQLSLEELRALPATQVV